MGQRLYTDFSLPSERVIRSLDRIIEWRGKPAAIRCDNGPEYISAVTLAWAVFGDAGYQGADKRPENADREVTWHIAM